MFFGGVNGLSIFQPEKVPDSEVAPSIVITNMKVLEKDLAEVNIFSEEMLSDKRRNKEVIHLRPEQRSFRIEFVGLHYVNPQKNKYAYRLEGFDQNWNYSDAQVRFANYTNLEPGEYTFKVKAANSDGVWSNEISAMSAEPQKKPTKRRKNTEFWRACAYLGPYRRIVVISIVC